MVSKIRKISSFFSLLFSFLSEAQLSHDPPLSPALVAASLTFTSCSHSLVHRCRCLSSSTDHATHHTATDLPSYTSIWATTFLSSTVRIHLSPWAFHDPSGRQTTSLPPKSTIIPTSPKNQRIKPSGTCPIIKGISNKTHHTHTSTEKKIRRIKTKEKKKIPNILYHPFQKDPSSSTLQESATSKQRLKTHTQKKKPKMTPTP